MIHNPPMYQNKPVDLDTTVKNNFGLVKQRFIVDECFKDHEDLQGSIGWYTSYKEKLIKALQDKVNKEILMVIHKTILI